MNNTHLDIAFKRTMGHEGLNILTNDKRDHGGATFSGISRVYWPDWEGWAAVDKGDFTKAADLVKQFYKVNFWNRMQGDTLAEMAPLVAYELFDTAVNVDVAQAVRFLQRAYNVGSGQSFVLVDDGKLGPKTMDTIRKYLTMQPGTTALNEEILLNCMNGEQYIFYKNNPQHKIYRGWFRRL